MKVLFVLPNVSRNATEQGQPISIEDLRALDTIADHAGVRADVVLAMQERSTWGNPRPAWKAAQAERSRLLAEINASDANFVLVFGTKAARSILNKGSGFTLTELKNHEHRFEGINKAVWFTNSLEELAAKSGLIKWMGLELLKAAHGDQPVRWGNYVVARELADKELPRAQTVTVDLETYPGVNPYDPNARIRMAVISHRTGWAQVVQADPDSRLPDWLAKILANPNIRKVGSNIRFDVRWLRRFGYEVRNFEDLPHLQHLLDENCGVKDLKSLTLRYHPTLGDYSEGNRKLVDERGGWEHLKDEEMYQYAGGDGDAGITIWTKLDESIRTAGMERARRVQSRIYEAFTELEINGAAVDLQVNQQLDERYTGELGSLAREIRQDLGATINLNSPAQLGKALQYAVPDINLRKVFAKREDEDATSTAANVLRREARKHPVLEKILRYRKLTALHRFVKAMPGHVQVVRGQPYVFTRLRGDVTVTHRQSSAGPNMQNIPREKQEGIAEDLNIKLQYVSRFEGGSIAEYDLSQAELREGAMITTDQALFAAFESGKDVHTQLAAMMLGIPEDRVTEDLRQDAKTTNFHVLYGGNAGGLAIRLGCSFARAQELINRFYETFQGYDRWRGDIEQFVRKNLYVESRFGFRRHFIRPVTWDSRAARHIIRQAVNQPLQNGAAMICGIGIAQAVEEMLQSGLKSKPFLSVHDSLLVDRFPGEETLVDEIVLRNMQHPNTELYGVLLMLPIVVDGKAGPSWGEAKEI